MLTVIQPGLLTSIQDGGRFGSAHLGIGTSGAADLPALRLANALVGNRADAAALEITLQGPTLETDADIIVALTGAPLPRARRGNARLPGWRPVFVPAGTRLTLGPMPEGCRSCLAVAGGFDLSTWRGSRATDINARLGPLPRPLARGDTLPVGTADTFLRKPEPSWSLDPRPWFDPSSPHLLRLMPGSHTSRLDAPSHDALTQETFVVDRDSNRVGLRLEGPELRLREPLELVSEGVATGTLQLPPGGHPILMGPEHPVTGGYPRIGQVASVDLPLLAQCRPGSTMHFRTIDLERATELLADREAALQRLVTDIGTRLENA